MKRLFLPIFVFLLLAGGIGLLGAFEVEVIGGVDGFTFKPDQTWAYTEPDTEKQFIPFKYWLASASFRYNISESLNWSINYERDNLMQNSVNALFGAKTDYFNVKFGPFLGFTDDFSIPDAGIIGNLELNLPGIVSLSIAGSSTLGSQYNFTSHTYRETAEVKLGFWIQNAIPSFSANIKFLSRQMDESVVVDDILFRYLFTLELFTKNHSVSGLINLGYQTYKRIYKKSNTEFPDKLSSWLAGVQVNWQIFRFLCLKAGFEMPLFISAEDPMTVTQEPFLTSRLYGGVVLSIK